jgi:hypothetical protein
MHKMSLLTYLKPPCPLRVSTVIGHHQVSCSVEAAALAFLLLMYDV